MKRKTDEAGKDEEPSKKQHLEEETEEVPITIQPTDDGITFETVESQMSLEEVESQNVGLEEVEGQNSGLENQGVTEEENQDQHMTFTVVDGEEVPLEVTEGQGQEVTEVTEVGDIHEDGVQMAPIQLSADGTVLHTVGGEQTLQMVVETGADGEIHLPTKDHGAPDIGSHIVTEGISADTLQSEHGILVEAVEGSMEEHYTVQQVGADGTIQQIMVDGDTIEEGALQVIEQSEDQILDSSQFADQSDELAGQYQNIIIQHMDIAEPLATLRRLLETRLHCSLSDHEFYLQDTLKLQPEKSLANQCVQGSGMVQINIEVKSQPGIKPRLNIVDILKPAEEITEIDETPAPPAKQYVLSQQASTHTPTSRSPGKVVIPFHEESENVTRWIVDQNFRKEQERLKIPFDPHQWNEAHVKHWIQWAVKEFKLEGVEIGAFKMTGRQLCALRHEEFIQYIPRDRGDVFWTHLELLRKCKFVAVIQQPTPHAITTITVSTSDTGLEARAVKAHSRSRVRSITIPSFRASGNRTGNNGQIQLWQFLLELLTDKECQEIIHWVGSEGEFKLQNPEMVAQLWGQRKNKPTMNYEKLSRALRYYYDGDMIAKVHGKRFVYKFVCDLTMLLGYSAGELNRLVSECADKVIQRVRENLKPTILRRTIEK